MWFQRPKPKNWDIKKYLFTHKGRIEARIAELPLGRGPQTPARDAFVYALTVPGKRFRPLLMLAVADIYNKSMDPAVLDCAIAIECVHTASLIFDDLPCMDDATLRRGKKPTHLVYGEDQALLAGMSLIAEANLLVCGGDLNGRSAKRRVELVGLLNRAFSLDGLSGGQSEDLRNKTSLTLAELEFIHARKTGALFEACTEMAAVLCRATSFERQCLRSYARNLGLAFQIQDDLLDLETEETTGKSAGRDQGKTTFVDLAGAEKSRALFTQLIDVALENLQPFGEAAAHVRELTAIIQTRTF